MRSRSFRQPVRKSVKLPPEANIWFWNPNRVGIILAPDWFRRKLKETLEGDLEITWNPINERWQVWERAGNIQHPVCHGWRLLFVHNGPAGEHLPLDERVFARLWSCSAEKNGGGRKYFDRIVAEMDRDKERFDKQWSQDTIDAAMPSFEHSKIQVSGFGHSNGSKFADYHA